jgi:hypothetical protein
MPSALKTARTAPSLIDIAVMQDGPQRLAQQLFAGPSAAVRCRKLQAWLTARRNAAVDERFALESLALAAFLREWSAELAPDLRKILAAELLAAIDTGRTLACREQPLVQQLLAGELPLAVAALPADVLDGQRGIKPACKAISAGMRELLTAEGVMAAAHVTLTAPLLACWARARSLAALCGTGVPQPRGRKGKAAATSAPIWPSMVERRYQRLLANAWRLARGDGSVAFSQGLQTPKHDALLRGALQASGDGQHRRILAASRQPSGGRRKSRLGTPLPSPSLHAEAACLAVLRPDWSDAGARLFVRYPGQTMSLELSCGPRLLLAGDWTWEVRRDGAPLRPTSDWDALCWFSDEDVDYLELEIQLGEDTRIQRHLLMARKDGFLLLADAVLGRSRGRLDYSGHLPLAAGIEWQGAEESREGHLAVKQKRLATVLPLALPEWRSDTNIGELSADAASLQLVEHGEGCAMFVPLFIDLRGERLRQRLTWRQLTVGETLATVPRDVAVGYRVAIGRQQWLLYRALARRGNRTLLGHNLSTETLVARFDDKGEVEPIVEIE